MKQFQVGIYIALLLVGIGASISVYANSSEPPPVGKVRININRPLSDKGIFTDTGYFKSARIKINGQKVVGLDKGEAYTGVFDSGKIIISVDNWQEPGYFILKLNAISGAEYTLDVASRFNEGPGGILPSLIYKSFNPETDTYKTGIEELSVDANIEKDEGPFQLVFRNAQKPSNGLNVVNPNDKKPIDNPTNKNPDNLNSQESKLNELKRLYDKGLISKEVYVERQRDILK